MWETNKEVIKNAYPRCVPDHHGTKSVKTLVIPCQIECLSRHLHLMPPLRDVSCSENTHLNLPLV